MPLEIINPITYTDTQTSLSVPAGTIVSSVSHTTPTGFLLCDGSNTVSRTTYSALFNAIVPNKGTVTITIATPSVVTLNSHGFLTGESIFLTTTGALPTGLSENTLYFVISVDGNTFRLATSYANAIAGTAINTSGSQSGTHTLFYCPYGLGNNTSNFKLPDLKNATIRGRGLSTGFSSNDTTRMGNLEDDTIQGHYHSISEISRYDVISTTGSDTTVPATSGGISRSPYVANTLATGVNGNVRSDNETRMKNQGVNFFIKF